MNHIQLPLFILSKVNIAILKTVSITGDLIPGKPCNNIDKGLIKTFL